MPKGKAVHLKIKAHGDPQTSLDVEAEVFRRGSKVYIVADFTEYTDNNKMVVNYYIDRLTKNYPK